MKFSSRKGTFFRILVLGSIAFFTILYIFGILAGWIAPRDFWIGIPLVVIIILLIWIYLGTSYQLTDTELIYRSGPIRGKVKVDEIREIVKGKTMVAGLKPATAAKGLIVKFRKYDEIYISPASNDSFVAEIVKRNPHILISE